MTLLTDTRKMCFDSVKNFCGFLEKAKKSCTLSYYNVCFFRKSKIYQCVYAIINIKCDFYI